MLKFVIYFYNHFFPNLGLEVYNIYFIYKHFPYNEKN